MGIGNRIKQRREYLGLSQEELARRLGYTSRSTVNKIGKGINGITQRYRWYYFFRLSLW